MRYAGATGQLTVRADAASMPTPWSPSAAKSASPSPSPAPNVRNDHRGGGLDAPTLLDGGRRRRGRDTYIPFESEPDATSVRLDRPAGRAQLPAGPLGRLQLSRLHHRSGREHPGPGGRPSSPRRDRECHPRPRTAWGSIISPPDASPPTAPVRCRPIPRWTARIGLGSRSPRPCAAQLLPCRTARRRDGTCPSTKTSSVAPCPIARPAAPFLTNRPTTLALIHQPVKALSDSRRIPGTATCCLRPLHTRLSAPTTGPLPAPPDSLPSLSCPFPVPHLSVRWIRG